MARLCRASADLSIWWRSDRRQKASDAATLPHFALTASTSAKFGWIRAGCCSRWPRRELESDLTQAIDPWIRSVRSITRLGVLALGLPRFPRIGEWSGATQRTPACARVTARRVSPPLPGDLAEPELPTSPLSAVAERELAAIAEETDVAETAQFLDTDANSFTFAVRTADKNRMIFESAYTNIRIGKATTKQSFPESLFRYGLTDRLELRLGYNYETTPSFRDAVEGDIAGNFGINAQQQIYYGFKYQVSRQQKEKQWQPTSAFLFQFHTPIASEQSHTQIRLGYALGWTLPNGWNVDTGFRYGTDRELGYDYTLWAPSAVVKIPFGRAKTVVYPIRVLWRRLRVSSQEFLETVRRYWLALFHYSELGIWRDRLVWHQ